VTEAWRRMVEVLRRLDLRKTPLFEDAVVRMSSFKSTGGPGVIGQGPGLGSVQGARPSSLATPPAGGVPGVAPAKTGSEGASGGTPPGTGGDTGANSPREAMLRAAIVASHRAAELKARADLAQAAADRAQVALDLAKGAAEKAIRD